MELNIWTGTTFLNGAFDQDDQRWTVQLRTADGGRRTMRPSHVIMAVGVSGIPRIPESEGTSDFAGDIIHSSGDSDHLDVKDKSVWWSGCAPADTTSHKTCTPAAPM